MTGSDMEGIGACVFDAYGTLFDVNAAVAHCADVLGDKWRPLAELWRAKQLQYTWLRALMGAHVPFLQVTGESLDFALESLAVRDEALRGRLLDLYFRLDAYPEVKQVLTALKDGGLKTAILSNGSPDMLAAAVGNAGIGDLLDAVYSVEMVGVFKPHPRVYQIPVDGLGLAPSAMSFQSANGWDANGAGAYGYRSVWINRFGQPDERIPQPPAHRLSDLTDLPGMFGLA